MQGYLPDLRELRQKTPRLGRVQVEKIDRKKTAFIEDRYGFIRGKLAICIHGKGTAPAATTEAQMLVTANSLTAHQADRLNQIVGYNTAYEAVVVKADGTTALLGYLRRHSMQGLDGFSFTAGRGKRIVAFLGSSDLTQARVDKKARAIILTDGGATVGTVRFSGRTERDAIYAGELPRLPA